jgi:hypothetical protein
MSLLGYTIHRHAWELIEHSLPPSHEPTASRVSPSLMLMLVLMLVLMLNAEC